MAAMAAFVIQRRKSRWTTALNLVILSGLVLPAAVVPTIWVLQKLELFKTMPGLILVEIAYALAFCVLLFQAFIAGDPQGAGRGSDHRRCRAAQPLLPDRVPVAEADHRHDRGGPVGLRLERLRQPLYFLPGDENATVQLTLYNFSGQYDKLVQPAVHGHPADHVPPLILFMFFQRQIVSGMTAGSVKG